MSREAEQIDGRQIDGAGLALAVGEDFRVFPEHRLPALDSPHAEAYLARDLRFPDEPLYALRCSRDSQPRLDVVRTLARNDEIPFAAPLGWAALPWPGDGRDHYVVVLRRPQGPRLVSADSPDVPRLREDELLRSVLPQFVAVLLELQTRQIGHRGIRPDNIFYLDEDRKGIMVGECVSEPPALSQPVLFETIPSAMAMATGRGAGGPAEDVYALGVLLVLLLNGGDPCGRMSDEEVVASKILHGTFGTLVRKARIPLGIMEPLRGMLSDDPAKRWTADDLQQWLSNRRQVLKSHTLPPKVPRPFEFMGVEYWHLETLADAMSRNWNAALEPVSDGRLMAWIKKCYGNNSAKADFIENIEQMMYGARKSPIMLEVQLASFLMAFDPRAPIRFRSLAVQPEALGRALAFGCPDAATQDEFQALLAANLPLTWIRCQPVVRPEFVPFKRAMETLRTLLERSEWGCGLDRCLYELNDSLPCRSPLLERFLVSSIDQLLPALETLAAEEPYERLPMDRDIAAFSVSHIKEVPKKALLELSEPEDSPQHRLGILRVLATVQKMTGTGGHRALGRWVLRSLSPAITEFHHRPYRQKLAERLQQLADQGALSHMLVLLDHGEARKRDDEGFKRARLIYDHAVREIEWLRAGGLTSPEHVTKGSHQAALLLSSVISGCVLLALTLVYVG